MIIPGVQKPHCRASCLMNASCKGCSLPFCESPSMVVTFFPSATETVNVHDRTTALSSNIEQAPHRAIPQAYLVPLSPNWLRITERRFSPGSRSISTFFPFNSKRIVVSISYQFKCFIHRDIFFTGLKSYKNSGNARRESSGHYPINKPTEKLCDEDKSLHQPKQGAQY